MTRLPKEMDASVLFQIDAGLHKRVKKNFVHALAVCAKGRFAGKVKLVSKEMRAGDITFFSVVARGTQDQSALDGLIRDFFADKDIHMFPEFRAPYRRRQVAIANRCCR